MSDPAFESFEQSVRDCLTHLYDYAFLQEHPLLRLLIPDAKGDASRIQAFRQLISDAIDTLKAEPDNPQSKQSRTYSILSLRYLHQQPVQQVLIKLNLSERQFYRDHTQALQVISRLLWDQLKDRQPEAADISIQTEIRRLDQQEPQQIDVRSFLEKTVQAIQSLCERYDAHITLDTGNAFSLRSANPTVLRQALIWLISQFLAHSPASSAFTVSSEIDQDTYRFVVRRLENDPEDTGLRNAVLQQETLATLVNVLEGRVYSLEHEACVILEVPQAREALLMIDDNPDAIALFRRYLTGKPYQLLTASDGPQATRIAQETQPLLIILDVMLPEQDGWEILRDLKSRHETQHIPVLVCSVLNASELAISLGADGFLRKPPGESEFLAILAKYAS